MREDELAATVGRRLPGGRVRIEPYVDWLWRDAVGSAPTTDGLLHPTAAFLAAQGGIGLELEEIFAMFGSSSADGPMLGEWSVDFTRPLCVDLEYSVRGVVEAATRKRGARTGVFDLATVLVELIGPDGEVHAAVRPTYVFPRRAEVAA
jgi:hypothetical protein